jgi:hypothetical protein
VHGKKLSSKQPVMVNSRPSLSESDDATDFVASLALALALVYMRHQRRLAC